jgi:hypothetical protein
MHQDEAQGLAPPPLPRQPGAKAEDQAQGVRPVGQD